MNPCPQDNLPTSQADVGGRPVFSLQQNVIPQVVAIQLQDGYGNDLSIAGTSSPPPSGSNPNPLSSPEIIVFNDAAALAGGTAALWMSRYTNDPHTIVVPGAYTSAGLVTFNMTSGSVTFPGMFLGTILISNASGQLIFAKNCYVSVEQNTTDCQYSNGPLDIVEVRMALRDFAFANTLIEDVEFSDREISSCIRKPVDWWNESLPPITGYNYSTFPFRLNWLNGTIACLLKLAAHWYRRNKLTVDAAGISVNYLDKAQEYQQVGEEMWKDYVAWCQNVKVSINIANGWDGVPGAYAR